ncbi:unnamed protein product [Jaminaea pallidilutea]
MIVKAKTGTGKTLAFLIPAIEGRVRAVEDVCKGNAFTPGLQRLVQKNQPNLDFSKMSSAERQQFGRVTYARNTVGVLIVSPTRELAAQIAVEAEKLLSALNQGGSRKAYNVHLLIGGASQMTQRQALNRNTLDVVVATPGRLLAQARDSPELRSALSATETLVLDEADTLLTMGFRQELDEINSYLPPNMERRTLMFSATISPDIKAVAQKMLSPRRKVIDCVPEGESNVHENVPQHCWNVPPEEYISTVIRLIAHDQLIHGSKSRVIVFCPTTKTTQAMAAVLQNKSIKGVLPQEFFQESQESSRFGRNASRSKAQSSSFGSGGGGTHNAREVRFGGATLALEMHSKLKQGQRDRTASNFRNHKIASVLVTSDVSARGVDYPDVTRVIQLDIPTNRDQYIHRVGRTGRAGKAGRADMVLVDPWQTAWLSTAGHGLPIEVHEGSRSATASDTLKQELHQLWSDKVASSGAQADTMPDADSAVITQGNAVEEVLQEVLQDEGNFERLEEEGAPTSGNILGSVFGSNMAFWVSKVADLRLSKRDIYEGARAWGIAALCLNADDLRLSAKMRLSLGIRNDTGFSRGRGGGGGYGRGGGYMRPFGGGGFDRTRDSFQRRGDGRDRRSSRGGKFEFGGRGRSEPAAKWGA